LILHSKSGRQSAVELPHWSDFGAPAAQQWCHSGSDRETNIVKFGSTLDSGRRHADPALTHAERLAIRAVANDDRVMVSRFYESVSRARVERRALAEGARLR
jgi:hypothetical protein